MDKSRSSVSVFIGWMAAIIMDGVAPKASIWVIIGFSFAAYSAAAVIEHFRHEKELNKLRWPKALD